MPTSSRPRRTPKPVTDRPLAASPFVSYRLKGTLGWIMIGAMDNQHAMREASRSTANPRLEDLQRWDGMRYVPCAPATAAAPV